MTKIKQIPIHEIRSCGKYNPGDLVNVHITNKKTIGTTLVSQFDGIVKQCRNGIYKIENPKTSDWVYASDNEMVKYPDYVKDKWAKGIS